MIQGIIPNKRGDVEEEGKVFFGSIHINIWGSDDGIRFYGWDKKIRRRAMKMLFLTYSRMYMGKQVKRSTFRRTDEWDGKRYSHQIATTSAWNKSTSGKRRNSPGKENIPLIEKPEANEQKGNRRQLQSLIQQYVTDRKIFLWQHC